MENTENTIRRKIAETFLDVAKGLESGSFAHPVKVALTALGSEHGEQMMAESACDAQKSGISVAYIGSRPQEGMESYVVSDDESAHKKMVELLDCGEVDAAVTMHFPFPIGVSTVGRVNTPAFGREMFLATTTGTASSDRIEGMVLNTIYGIITAKACGVKDPTVGILNVDGARQTQMILEELQKNGYSISFAQSHRADGGCVMRGNDILAGSCDIMVTDPLSGNILTKLLSAFTTGGSFESIGYGYGPGIGRDYDKLILIISRASGRPVVANAMRYAAELVRADYRKIAKAEFEAAEKAGLSAILEKRRKQPEKQTSATAEIPAPPKEVVTETYSGIEIMDLDNAVAELFKAGIYAESGMGCTGPVVLVSKANYEKAGNILRAKGYIGG